MIEFSLTAISLCRVLLVLRRRAIAPSAWRSLSFNKRTESRISWISRCRLKGTGTYYLIVRLRSYGSFRMDTNSFFTRFSYKYFAKQGNVNSHCSYPFMTGSLHSSTLIRRVRSSRRVMATFRGASLSIIACFNWQMMRSRSRISLFV